MSVHEFAAASAAGASHRSGDRGTGREFAGVLESLRPEVLRFSCWLARDRVLAEDIVQETLLRAWRAREALKDRASVRAWLLTIARREHARLYERKRVDLVSLEDGIEPREPALEWTTNRASLEHEVEELREAIGRLPLAYREPLVMQVLGGYSTQEIARELGLSLTAVLTRLFRARGALRDLCEHTRQRPCAIEPAPAGRFAAARAGAQR